MIWSKPADRISDQAPPTTSHHVPPPPSMTFGTPDPVPKTRTKCLRINNTKVEGDTFFAVGCAGWLMRLAARRALLHLLWHQILASCPVVHDTSGGWRWVFEPVVPKVNQANWVSRARAQKPVDAIMRPLLSRNACSSPPPDLIAGIRRAPQY
jgi:hypothetical protein